MTGLADSDRRTLLAVVRAVVLNGDQRAWSEEQWRAAGFDVSPALLEIPTGVFVTLRRPDGELRGCIGTTSATISLIRAVARYSDLAARGDRRFAAVEAEEAPRLGVHVSVLMPERALDSAAEIRLGVDGVRLEHRDGGALFLPEVATEAGWDTTTLLEQLARKAGLDRHAWRAARLYAFETVGF